MTYDMNCKWKCCLLIKFLQQLSNKVYISGFPFIKIQRTTIGIREV